MTAKTQYNNKKLQYNYIKMRNNFVKTDDAFTIAPNWCTGTYCKWIVEDMNDLIAKKVKFVPLILIPISIILGIICVFYFILSVMDGFDFDYFSVCITTGPAAVTAIVIAIRSMRLPKVLIIANETGFVFTTIGEQIPYDVVYAVRSKYNDRKIIIMTEEGTEYIIDYVAKYKEVKKLIAQKVKDKTGRHIIVA